MSVTRPETQGNGRARSNGGAVRRVWLSDLTHLDVDMRLTSSICEAAARAVPRDIGVVISPPVPFGISEHHMAFPGTLSVDSETFVTLVWQIGRSLVHHGFENLVIVNGHGGNVGALQIIASKLTLDSGARHVVYLSEWDLARAKFADIRESEPGGARHACEYETSLYLHLREDMVRMEEAVIEQPDPIISGGTADLFSPGPYRVALRQDLSTSGTLGNPMLASREKGEILFDAAVDSLKKIIVELAHA
jgi:creatinine amidohydrolase